MITMLIGYAFRALTLCLGDRKGIRPKNLLLQKALEYC